MDPQKPEELIRRLAAALRGTELYSPRTRSSSAASTR
jgi:hypothetical protein